MTTSVFRSVVWLKRINYFFMFKAPLVFVASDFHCQNFIFVVPPQNQTWGTRYLLLFAFQNGAGINFSLCLNLKKGTLRISSIFYRYSGYCAWRGVLDFSKIENSETITGIRKAYPDLGKCLYFDLASGTHSVLYELLNKKLNWIWYVNQPEPEVKVT